MVTREVIKNEWPFLVGSVALVAAAWIFLFSLGALNFITAVLSFLFVPILLASVPQSFASIWFGLNRTNWKSEWVTAKNNWKPLAVFALAVAAVVIGRVLIY